jgi:Holliday junction resolvase RusA-like endonuclease
MPDDDPALTQMVWFGLEGDPQGKDRARSAVRRKRDGGLYCQPISTPAMKVAERAVALAFKSANPGWEPLPAGTAIHVWMIFAEKPRQRSHQRDVDNLGKLVLDALNGVAWHDDKDVISVHAEVQRGSAEPHTFVRIAWQ